MSVSLFHLVLLDNTVLSNFAQINRSDLVTSIWPACSTTLEARQEFLAGLAAGKLPEDVWQELPLITLTPAEIEIADGLSNVLGLGERICVAVAKIRTQLEHSGQLIGSMDLLIAAHAVSLDAILVTNNLREFQRIHELILEGWIS